MRSATQPYCNTVEYGCVSLPMRFFPQNFGTIKRILPGSSSPSHSEGPGIEVKENLQNFLQIESYKPRLEGCHNNPNNQLLHQHCLLEEF